MNRKEAMRQAHQEQVLQSLGFTADETQALRRISITLRRWFELECGDGNGHIERDEETGKPRYISNRGALRNEWPIPDRETGAKKRLAKILADCNARRTDPQPEVDEKWSYCASLSAYIQTDPRGAALYILRPGDVPAGEDVSAYYSRGICVY